MTDNRTTELLQELRDLACDMHAAEIISHVYITHRGWVINSEWLDSWHEEFDRVMQAIADELNAERHVETCENMREKFGYKRLFVCSECGVTFDPDCEINYCPSCGCKVVDNADK